MKYLLFILSLILISTQATQAGLCAYGFTSGDNNIQKIYNIMKDFAEAKPNIMILFSTDTDVTQNAEQVQGLLGVVNAFGGKGIISVADIAFNRVTPGSEDCSDYGGGNVTGAQTWSLRSDYQSRLTTFFNYSSDFSDFSKVFAISIHEEVNNDCVKQSEIESVSNYIKNSLNITTIPLAVAYGDSLWPLASYDAKDLPASFPTDTDIIALWDYGGFDPNTPSHPLNGSATWPTRWASIKSKLGSRKVIIAINSWCTTAHESAGWTPDCDTQEPLSVDDYLHVVPTTYWALWMLDQPEVIGAIGFEYDFKSDRYVEDMPLNQAWIKNLIKAQNCIYTFP